MRANLTLEQFADRLNVKRSGPLSTLENSRRVPKAATIRRHAAALGCTPADLLAGVLTEYDVLRGVSTPTPSVVPERTTMKPIEAKALRLFAASSDTGQKRALGLLDEVRRAFPRKPPPQSKRQSGETSGVKENKGRGTR